MTPRSFARTPKCKGRTWAHDRSARISRRQGALPHVRVAAVVGGGLLAVRPQGLWRTAGPDHRAAAEFRRSDHLVVLAGKGRLPLEGAGSVAEARRRAADGRRGTRKARHLRRFVTTAGQSSFCYSGR